MAGSFKHALVAIAATIAAALWLPPAAKEGAAEYWQAKTAYDLYEWKKAFELALPLAEAGNAKAQHMLSILYSLGRGVPQDDCEATKWADRAARQGYAKAYYHMAFAHFSGLGVPVNNELAYRWALAAAQAGDKDAKKQLSMFGAGLWEAQRRRIRQTMATWRPQDQPPVKIRRLPNNLYGLIMRRFTKVRPCTIGN
jgi:TPR repeat protein